jgi:hypothetical protein
MVLVIPSMVSAVTFTAEVTIAYCCARTIAQRPDQECEEAHTRNYLIRRADPSLLMPPELVTGPSRLAPSRSASHCLLGGLGWTPHPTARITAIPNRPAAMALSRGTRSPLCCC